jgi:COP9 signalosome complex subunit 3
MGLVIQVLGAFRRFLIQRLERIYAAVPISVVAQKTSPQPDNVAETEAYVTSLIASGQLNAALEPAKDPSQGSMLRFAISSYDGRLAHNEAHHLDELTKQITRFAELDVHVKGAERRLELTKEYLDHTRKVRKGKDSDNSIFASTYPTDGVEEDVFADM